MLSLYKLYAIFLLHITQNKQCNTIFTKCRCAFICAKIGISKQSREFVSFRKSLELGVLGPWEDQLLYWGFLVCILLM